MEKLPGVLAVIEEHRAYRLFTMGSAFVIAGGLVIGILDKITRFPFALAVIIAVAVGVLVVIFILAWFGRATFTDDRNLLVALGAVKVELMAAEVRTEGYISEDRQPTYLFEDEKFKKYESVLALRPTIHATVSRAFSLMWGVNDKQGMQRIELDEYQVVLTAIKAAIAALDKS